MWSESSSVNAANLVKKICSNSRDIEFFLLDFLARPIMLVLVHCQTAGILLVSKHLLKSLVNGYTITFLISYTILGCFKSGSSDLLIFNLFKRVWVSGTL